MKINSELFAYRTALLMKGCYEMEREKYRVWLDGHSMTARYDGHVDVYAEDEEQAEWEAKHKLTRKGGTFSDWSPSMFKTVKVERIF